VVRKYLGKEFSKLLKKKSNFGMLEIVQENKKAASNNRYTSMPASTPAANSLHALAQAEFAGTSSIA
jgi:hypothetical protein